MIRPSRTRRPHPIQVKDKGLRKNALSFLSNIVIGVASAAPAYSIASALGPIAGSASFATPAIMIVAFLPMLFIAVAYYYLNRVDPDCGTTFSWVTLAMGPTAGWIGGWVLLITNVIVMPSMAVIAGQYSFLLFGVDNPSPIQVTAAGVAWIAVLTAICYAGIELSARTQQVLLGTELAILLLFAVMALAKVYTSSAPMGSMPVSLDWFNPFKVESYDDFLKAFLVAVFIYWGWDSSLAVNEETENPQTTPGVAAVTSTFLLVAVYVLVSAAAISFAGPRALSTAAENDTGDIFAAYRQERARFLARQAAHPCRADIGGGCNTDDNPARRPDGAVDGKRGRHPRPICRNPPAFQKSGLRHSHDGGGLDPLVHFPEELFEECARRFHRSARALHRFLLRADGICLRDRLSQTAFEKRQEFRAHGRDACLRRRNDGFSPCRVLPFAGTQGAPVGLWDRAAAWDRFSKPCHRHHPDVCRQEGFARLLPA